MRTWTGNTTSDGAPGIGNDQAVRVYEGEPADVMFLRSLLESAGIEIVAAGVFFGPGREIYVRGRDVADARAIIADVEAQPPRGPGEVASKPRSSDE